MRDLASDVPFDFAALAVVYQLLQRTSVCVLERCSNFVSGFDQITRPDDIRVGQSKQQFRFLPDQSLLSLRHVYRDFCEPDDSVGVI